MESQIIVMGRGSVPTADSFCFCITDVTISINILVHANFPIILGRSDFVNILVMTLVSLMMGWVLLNQRHAVVLRPRLAFEWHPEGYAPKGV